MTSRRATKRKISRSLAPVIESLEQRLQFDITLIESSPNLHELEKPTNTYTFSLTAQNFNYTDAHTARFQWGDNKPDTVRTVYPDEFEDYQMYPIANHTFSNPGVYNVTVTITNSHNESLVHNYSVNIEKSAPLIRLGATANKIVLGQPFTLNKTRM